MSKEKQIEERIELSDIIDYALRDWDDYIYECQEEGNRPIDTFEEWIADAVLKNGYRKQKEGEWIEHETAWGDVFYSCSVCGDERCAVDGSVWKLVLNFCPNCGAKMKGGAE